MKRFRFALRLLMTVVLSALTLEVAARLDDWFRYRANLLSYYGSKNLRWVDSSGISYNRPDAAFEKWRNDENGFRWHPAAADSLEDCSDRWICIGTSETYGLYERPGGEWPAALGALVAPEGIRVDNAAVVGMSPFAYIPYLQHYVLSRSEQSPDRVIILVSPFSIVSGMQDGSVPGPEHFSDILRINRMRRFSSPGRLEHSRFLPKARAALISRLPGAVSRRVSVHLKKRKMASRIQSLAGSQASLDGPSSEMLIEYRALLENLTDYLRQEGVAVAFCTYPNNLRHDTALSAVDVMLDRQLALPAYTPAGLIAISSAFAEVTRHYCLTDSIPLIDLEAALGRNSSFFADSVHLTDDGAALAAKTAYLSLSN